MDARCRRAGLGARSSRRAAAAVARAQRERQPAAADPVAAAVVAEQRAPAVGAGPGPSAPAASAIAPVPATITAPGSPPSAPRCAVTASLVTSTRGAGTAAATDPASPVKPVSPRRDDVDVRAEVDHGRAQRRRSRGRAAPGRARAVAAVRRRRRRAARQPLCPPSISSARVILQVVHTTLRHNFRRQLRSPHVYQRFGSAADHGRVDLRALIARLPLTLRALVLVPLLAAGLDQARVSLVCGPDVRSCLDAAGNGRFGVAAMLLLALYTSAVAALVGRVAGAAGRGSLLWIVATAGLWAACGGQAILAGASAAAPAWAAAGCPLLPSPRPPAPCSPSR